MYYCACAWPREIFNLIVVIVIFFSVKGKGKIGFIEIYYYSHKHTAFFTTAFAAKWQFKKKNNNNLYIKFTTIFHTKNGHEDFVPKNALYSLEFHF